MLKPVGLRVADSLQQSVRETELTTANRNSGERMDSWELRVDVLRQERRQAASR